MEKKKTLLKRIRDKLKEHKEQGQIEKHRPQGEPEYEGFKVLKTSKGSIDEFERRLINADSTIGIILGRRGVGKTAMGVRLLENIKSNVDKDMYALGFKKGTLPKWIKQIDNIDEVQDYSFLLVDENGINFNSRKSMSKMNRVFSEMLFISRHKNLSIILVAQCSSNIDVNGLRQADYIILKPSSLMQIPFERRYIANLYELQKNNFNKYKDDKGLAFIYSDELIGFVSNTLPSFWSDAISKAYKS